MLEMHRVASPLGGARIFACRVAIPGDVIGRSADVGSKADTARVDAWATMETAHA
jgi:hypothetical protein